HLSPSAHTNTLSLHDALPILCHPTETIKASIGDYGTGFAVSLVRAGDILKLLHEMRPADTYEELDVRYEEFLLQETFTQKVPLIDRKSTRLNSSHVKISYAVF